MPRHYHDGTTDFSTPTVDCDDVNALTVNATDVDCDTLTATTVSGDLAKVSGDVHTMDGDVVVAASGQGVILRDDSGVYWRVQVDLTGNLTTTAL